MGTRLNKIVVQELFDEICKKVEVDAELVWSNRRKTYWYNEDGIEVNLLGLCGGNKIRIFINSIEYWLRRKGAYKDCEYFTEDKTTMAKLIILHELAHAEINHEVTCSTWYIEKEVEKLQKYCNDFTKIYDDAINHIEANISGFNQESLQDYLKIVTNDLKEKQEIINEKRDYITSSMDESKYLRDDSTNHDLMFEVYFDDLVDKYISAGGILNMTDSRERVEDWEIE
jgi:hypothetical protein